MRILVIDGQGGKIGKYIIEGIKASGIKADITAVGTNSASTSAMLKAGADRGATGENSVVVCSKKCDVIVGPIGIVVADSLLGEVTAEMAVAVGRSPAKKLLIPINQCDNFIVGVSDLSMAMLIKSVVDELIRMQ
ncbi:MAG: DUF3842 family protein [Acutalibacteraceae bacterium]|nr:DUF3842 family protein [Acutalibacteraceae bacterium]